MVGEDDRVPLKSALNRRVPIMSPEWKAEYARRLDRVMKAVKGKNARVYWVGLPDLARADANEQAQGMNEVMRERAYQNGFALHRRLRGLYRRERRLFGLRPGPRGQNPRAARGQRRELHRSGQPQARTLRREGAAPRSQSGQSERVPFRSLATRTNSPRSIPTMPSRSRRRLRPPRPRHPAEAAAKPVITAPAADPSGDQKADNGKFTPQSHGRRRSAKKIPIHRDRAPGHSGVRRVADGPARGRRTGGRPTASIRSRAASNAHDSVTPSGQKGPGKL